ncbi:MAG: hypothetical protein V1918_10045 [Planctomycetota bacterium]
MGDLRVPFLAAMAGLAGLWLVPAAESRADTVFFKSGNELVCKVVPPAPGDRLVCILVGAEGKGRMLLRAETIDRIEYDYDSQIAALKDEDYAGHYKLGLWCLERDLVEKALERLLYVQGKKGIPPEVEFYLGRAYEHLAAPQPVKARDHYENYLKIAPGGPHKEEAAATLVALKAFIQKHGLDKAVTLTDLTARGGEGLEVLNWVYPSWGFDAAIHHPRVKGGKNAVLEIDCQDLDNRGRQPSADKRKTPVQLGLDRDMSATPVLCLDVYNPGESPMQFAAAFVTGSRYVWYESMLVSVPPKEWLSARKFRLSAKEWKSEATGWKYNATEVKDIDQVKNLIFVIYNNGEKSTLFFDAVGFDKN